MRLECLENKSHLVIRGSRFVAVYCGPYLIVSVYVSPILSLIKFNAFLDDLSDAFSNKVDKIFLGGDFNAKASLWGSRVTNGRGRLLSCWAAERDLRTLNVGCTPTCVRPEGTSVVDITWSSPDLVPLVRDWRVLVGVESLSDNFYISFVLGTHWPCLPPNRTVSRRWNMKKFNGDLFRATLIWYGERPVVEEQRNVDQMVNWLDKVMEEAFF